MASLAVAFDILARDKASKTMDKVADKSEKTGKRVSGAFAGVGAKIAAGFAVIGTVSAFKGFISEAEESRRIGRLTEQVIKSTGGEAKITAAQVNDLATAISNKTGVDDEAIQSGENLLLTFTNIQNRAGEGNKIFDRATEAITDMSAALGQDMKSSAIQVGKALNDPIKGVTALSRAGVSFTKQQKDQIKTLVASGKTLDAQKIILNELGKEFGGAAAAAASPTQKLGVIFGNLKEQIGTALLPLVDKLATFLGTTLIPAATKLGSAIKSKLAPPFRDFFDGLSGNFAAIQKHRSFFTELGLGIMGLVGAFKDGDVTSNGFVGTMERIGVALRAVVGFVRTKVIPAVRQFAKWVRTDLVPALADAATWINANVVPVLQKIAQFIVQDVVPAVRRFAQFVMTNVVPAIAEFTQRLAKSLRPAVEAIAKFIRDRVIPALQGLWKRFREVSPTLEKVAKIVLKVVGALVLLAAKILGTVIPIVLKLAGPIFTTLFNAIGKVIGIISGIVRAFIWMGNKAKDVGAKIGDVAGSIVRVISGLPGKIKSAASGMFDGIKDAFRGALNWIIDKWNGLSFGLPSVDTHIPGIGTVGGWSLSTPNIDRFANGGWIRGPGGPRSDRVPLLGSNGEFMVNAFAARKYGRVLERMNSGRPLPLAGSGGTVVNIDQITNVKPEQNLSVVDQIRQSLWLKGLTAP